MKTLPAQITLSYSFHADISSETPIEISRCLRNKHVIVLTVVVSGGSCMPGYMLFLQYNHRTTSTKHSCLQSQVVI